MTSRKTSVSEVKKSQKITTSGSSESKSYECEVCQSVVGSDDKGIECEICKQWFHITCVDIKEYEYEVLAKHKIGTIHWYCDNCNIKSVQLLRLVFGLQDRLQKVELDLGSLKNETTAKMNKIETNYEAVRDDLKSLSQKIDNGIKQCLDNFEDRAKTIQSETRDEINKINRTMNTKIDRDYMENALTHHTAVLTEETYASKIKDEVDQHLNGMDSQISRVNDKIDEVRRKTVVEQDRENRISNIILYNVEEPQLTTNRDERWKADREFCLELFNKVLKVPITDEDITKFARLGRVDSLQQGKSRPVLIKFRDRILKNMVMESVGN